MLDAIEQDDPTTANFRGIVRPDGDEVVAERLALQRYLDGDGEWNAQVADKAALQRSLLKQGLGEPST